MNITSFFGVVGEVFLLIYIYRHREIRLSRPSGVISEQNQTDYERIVNGL